MPLVFQIILIITAICFLALVGTAVGPRALSWGMSPRHPKEKNPARAFDANWGGLPVVKVTGSKSEGRFVETRRISVGAHRFETRLYVRGDVMESHRYEKHDEAMSGHDDICQRNGVNPNEGAAPGWYSLGRERAKRHAVLAPGEDLEDDYRAAISAPSTDGPQHASGDVHVDYRPE